MNKTGNTHNTIHMKDDRLNKRATSLAIFAIVVYAIYHCINFAVNGLADRIWIVLSGCAIVFLVIILSRRARGILNPAFTVPFIIYIVYIIASIMNTRFSGFFTIFFCICGLAMMFFNPWRFLLFITFANTISLILILTGAPMAMSLSEQIVNWIFSVIGSLFLYLVIQFISEKIKKSVMAEDSFKTLLSSTPDYIVLVDEKNCVSYISKPLAEFAHIEEPEMAIGRPLLDIFREMDVKLKAAEILDSQGFYEDTWELSTRAQSEVSKALPQDKEIRYFRIISNRLLGESAGIFISLIDITSLVRARSEAEAADKAKSAFLANTSHEIRTPMNAILGMAELILRKDIPLDIFEDVTSIKQAGTNLITIINDVLDISKIESGKLEIIPVEYHFSSMINDVINIIRMRLIEKQLDFITYIDGSLPSILVGDETRIRQVLLNLLSNSVKYTKDGEIILRIFSIETKSDEDLLPGIILVFEVADTGIGIREENKVKLFGEFEQFDTRANRGVEGTGLGLAISRNLCRLMGGDIIAKSEYGKGSVFRAIIPQDVKDSTPFAIVKNSEEKNVLIYEERDKRLHNLTYSLGKLGMRHHLACSQEEFLNSVKTGKYQYVLISFYLFTELREKINSLYNNTSLLGQKIRFAVIADYFDTELKEEFHAKNPVNYKLFSMPVHPITLANFLNDEDEAALGIYKNLSSFIAPSARLLIVDDIATNLKVAEGLLEPYQTTVDTCLSGMEAINMVKKQKYDLIFMDHMMPIMNGIETTTAIRALEKEQSSLFNASEFPQTEAQIETMETASKRIPIVALTANAVSGMREMFLEIGFDDFLPKPIEINKLDEILRKWIPEEKREKLKVNSEQLTVKEQGLKAMRDSNNQSSLTPVLLPANFSLLTSIGVDVKQGLTMTGGTIDKYLNVIDLFRKDAEERLPLLKGFIPDNIDRSDLIDKNEMDFSLFTTQVHALKSAMASLGASLISKEAANLEAAGKVKDIGFIREALPGFNASLIKLLDVISELLSRETPEKETPENGLAGKANAADYLPKLRKLKKALAKQKFEEIDDIIDSIKEDFNQKAINPTIRKAIETISNQVLLAEYDEAQKTVNLLISELTSQDNSQR